VPRRGGVENNNLFIHSNTQSKKAAGAGLETQPAASDGGVI
jgi:hypothetical protein